MTSIPRIQPTLPLKDIVVFLRNLFRKIPHTQEQHIIHEFEQKFAERYDYPQAVCLSKARIAFYFLLKHMNLKPGGEILISAIHVADFVNMIRLAGLKPVAVDLDKNTYHIDYNDLKRKITPNTVLMFITHLSGYATDMAKIMDVSQRNNIPVIEDCSQVISSMFQGRRLGTFGKAAIFSLSLLKPVCTLSGGMIISRDSALLEAIRKDTATLSSSLKFPIFLEAVKNIVVKTAVHRTIFKWIVFPLIRLTMPIGDFFSRYQKTNKTVILRKQVPKEFLTRYSWQQAVMGLSQLKTLAEREKRRTDIGMYLYKNIPSKPPVTLPVVEEGSLNTFWLFPVIADNPDRLKRFLAQHGIDSSKFLLSVLSKEEAFMDYQFTCDTAEEIRYHTLFIPMYPALSQGELDQIIQTLNTYQTLKS